MQDQDAGMVVIGALSLPLDLLWSAMVLRRLAAAFPGAAIRATGDPERPQILIPRAQFEHKLSESREAM